MKDWINDFVHNAIIHPIMPFLPVEVGDRLHDWHARKVFGNDRSEET